MHSHGGGSQRPNPGECFYFMYIDKANKILSRIKFLHYKFKLVKGYENYYFLEISLQTPDTRNRTEIIGIIHRHSIDLNYIQDERQFIQIIFEYILKVLKHEAAELFLIDGKAPFDEHNENDNKFDFLRSMFTPEQNRIYQQMENHYQFLNGHS